MTPKQREKIYRRAAERAFLGTSDYMSPASYNSIETKYFFHLHSQKQIEKYFSKCSPREWDLLRMTIMLFAAEMTKTEKL